MGNRGVFRNEGERSERSGDSAIAEAREREGEIGAKRRFRTSGRAVESACRLNYFINNTFYFAGQNNLALYSFCSNFP